MQEITINVGFLSAGKLAHRLKKKGAKVSCSYLECYAAMLCFQEEIF